MRHIAVLTPFEGDMPFTARHPDDGAKVAAALQRCRPGWQFDTWRVSDEHWPDDDAAYDGIVITGNVITDPAQRRQGYAAAMMRTGLAWAREAGATIAALNVAADNDAAQALYSGLGYRKMYDYAYRTPQVAR